MEKKNNAEFLKKWYGYLFWLIIPTVIGNILTNETVLEWFPGLQRIGSLVDVCVGVVWALILLKLKDHSAKLAVAGWGMIGLAAWGLFEGFLLSHLGIAMATAVVAVIVSLVVAYHEYYGHSEVLEPFNAELAEKWRKLWKWEIASLGATLGSLVLAAMIPIVGLLVVLVGAVALLVVAILKWVYLYETKKFFEEYLVLEKYKDIPPLVDSRAEFSEPVEAVTLNEPVAPVEVTEPVERIIEEEL